MNGLRMGRAIALLCMSLALVGCSSSSGPSKDDLVRENQELKARLADSERATQNQANPQQLAAMRAEIETREARIRELEKQLRTPEPAGAATPAAPEDPGIKGIETSYDRRKGELTVNLPSDVLFASGKTDLKPSAKATLDKIVAALKKDYAGKKVRVEGHTDRDPIAKSKWQDNLELSLQRSAAVARYLAGKGIDSKNISATGFGDTHPKSTKASSRRVEIVVVTG